METPAGSAQAGGRFPLPHRSLSLDIKGNKTDIVISRYEDNFLTGEGGRYSLLVHHTVDELREFGLTDEMIDDQMWQRTARPGELNYNFITNGPSFFTHFS
ncbi:hypothetical protein TRIUR3_33617 [Triticum urartu]|uniref:Uncharacterized protein n=1 Tax=Triticum urartu TaxID=4572 RepID=M7Z7W2_TRIUA|nr:hypothetical protein TRIUR3_33617 [Triticum urartu]